MWFPRVQLGNKKKRNKQIEAQNLIKSHQPPSTLSATKSFCPIKLSKLCIYYIYIFLLYHRYILYVFIYIYMYKLMIWSSKNNAKIDGWNNQNSVMSKFQTGTGIPPNSKMPRGLGKTSVEKSQIQNVQTHPKNWSMHLCCGIAVECGVYGWGYTHDGYGPGYLGSPVLSRLGVSRFGAGRSRAQFLRN